MKTYLFLLSLLIHPTAHSMLYSPADEMFGVFMVRGDELKRHIKTCSVQAQADNTEFERGHSDLTAVIDIIRNHYLVHDSIAKICADQEYFDTLTTRVFWATRDLEAPAEPADSQKKLHATLSRLLASLKQAKEKAK